VLGAALSAATLAFGMTQASLAKDYPDEETAALPNLVFTHPAADLAKGLKAALATQAGH
jgi:hypothetical protein